MFTTTTTNRPVVAYSPTAVAGTALVAAAHAGTVVFYKQRSNGTLRHWPVLAPNSKARKQATTWQAAVKAGTKIPALAASSKVSVPTLRRGLTALAFTVELEKSNKTALAALAKQVQAKPVTAKPATAAPAKPAKPVASKPSKAKAAPKAKATGKPSVKQQAAAHAAKNSTIGNTVAAVAAK